MGVKDLWPVLQPAGAAVSFARLSTIDGWEKNPSGLRGLRVGVDAPSWLYHGGTASGGHEAALRMLFYRCCDLLKHPFIAVFVFDGALRPEFKRGKLITSKQTKLIKSFKRLIEMLGYNWLEAAGEAEAELAQMQRAGVVDIVMSEDVDALIFGCTRMVLNPGGRDNRNHSGYSIIRRTPQKNHKTHLVTFTSADIESTVGLTQGGLVLIALMSGGDYDTTGIRSCGIAFACGLAKCGFGDELLEAARTMDAQALTGFITLWRERVRNELVTNSSGHLPSRRPSIVRDTHFATFPNRTILDYYVNPATSLTHPETRSQIHWGREINLGQLVNLCQEKFRWQYDTLASKFQNFVLRGVVVQVLRRATIRIDDPRNLSPHHASYLLPDEWVENDTLFHEIIGARSDHPSTDMSREYLVTVSFRPLLGIISKALNVSTHDMSIGDDNAKDSLSVWLPTQLLESARPDLILEYNASHYSVPNEYQTKLDDFYSVKRASSSVMHGSTTGAQGTHQCTSGEGRPTKRRRH